MRDLEFCHLCRRFVQSSFEPTLQPLTFTGSQAKKMLGALPDLNHEYLPIAGLPEFLAASQKLVFGQNSKALSRRRLTSVQTLWHWCSTPWLPAAFEIHICPYNDTGVRERPTLCQSLDYPPPCRPTDGFLCILLSKDQGAGSAWHA
jgi:hypothetical protein